MGNDQQFDNRGAARTILRTTASGALATLDETGAPFASFVNVATTQPGEPILLLSDLAVHTRNLKRDRRASLLLVEDRHAHRDPVATGRLSVSGRISVAGSGETAALRRRYLARHHEATGYADFADFSFFRLNVESAHLVAGFGRIATLEASDILTDMSGCEALAAAEPDLLAWLNGEGAAAVARFFAVAQTKESSECRATGVDPDGADFMVSGSPRRVDFARRMQNGEAVRTSLAALLV